MLSQTSEYALRAAVCLAANPQEPKKTKDIALVTKVSSGYLSKVLQTLARAGLVESQRGLHGGFRLARDPSEVTVFEVVNAVDPMARIHTCPLGLKAHGNALCALHRKLDDAYRDLAEAFRSSTLADLLSDENPSKPLCSIRS